MKRQRPSLLYSVLVVVVLLLFTSSFPAYSAPLSPPTLVKDINTATANSFPNDFVNFNGTLFFDAVDKVHGGSLWKSDGTEAGTVIVKTIVPGVENNSNISQLHATTTHLFFTSWKWIDNEFQRILFQSDGTDVGTVQVSGIFTDATIVGSVGNLLYFTANDAEHGRELWRTDGTNQGTIFLLDINLGFGSSFERYTPSATVIGNEIYFAASDGSNGGAAVSDLLWKSDGTANGTTLVRDIIIDPNVQNASIQSIESVNGILYFTVYYAIGNQGFIELWHSDGGSENTYQIKRFALPPGSSTYAYSDYAAIHLFTNNRFFVALNYFGQLWVSDGTEAGTTLVHEFGVHGIRYPAVSDGTNYYFVASPFDTGSALWKSDGTVEGTQQIMDLYPDANNYKDDRRAFDLVVFQNQIYFSADDGIHGIELWRTDGSVAGTTLLKDINPFYEGSRNDFYDYHPLVLNNTMFFVAYDPQTTMELWRSDGTPVGTQLVKDINYVETGDACPDSFVQTNKDFFFLASQGATGRELWKSDGTSAGTALVRDFYRGSSSGTLQIYATVGDRVYFEAVLEPNLPNSYPYALWVSDGTEAGTTVITTTIPYVGGTIYGPSSPHAATLNNNFYFLSYDFSTSQITLWRVDGVIMNVVKQFDVSGLSPSFHPIAANGLLYFNLNSELWRTDGTSTGTLRLTQGNYLALTEFHGQTYFVNEQGLWKSDGTEAGTLFLKSIPDPREIVATENQIFIKAYGSFWKSDGTDTGTELLASVSGDTLVRFWNAAFFVRSNNSGNTVISELWGSDGTSSGTQLLHQFYAPYDSSHSLYAFSDFNGQLYFVFQQYQDSGINKSLWRTNGTAEGTVKVFELKKKIDDNATDCGAATFVSGGHLYFTGNDGQHGIELWMLDEHPAPIIEIPLFLPLVQR